MSESDSSFDAIVELAGQLASLNDRAALIYRPIVDDIVGDDSTGEADSVIDYSHERQRFPTEFQDHSRVLPDVGPGVSCL